MRIESFGLEGQFVRLEPLGLHHVDALLAAARVDPSLYQWTAVAQDRAGMQAYVETALSWQEAGTAMPFAIARRADGAVIGSTRFFDVGRLPWPPGHPMRERKTLDVCEIGYTWLTRDAIRTAANSEAKLLMLTHAFETWRMLRVCLHTDERNARSRAAMERMGARFEGILRVHRVAVDGLPRNSARFSIVAEEWPAARARLAGMMQRYA